MRQAILSYRIGGAKGLQRTLEDGFYVQYLVPELDDKKDKKAATGMMKIYQSALKIVKVALEKAGQKEFQNLIESGIENTKEIAGDIIANQIS